MKAEVLFAAALTLLAACGPSDGPVAIQTLPPGIVCNAARVGGTLVPDPSFGVGLQNGDRRDGAVWPNGYSARRVNGVIELLDPSGAVVARQGDHILAAGGGYVTAGGVQVQDVDCSIQVNPSPVM